MPLVTTSQFNLSPQVGGALQQGASAAGQFNRNKLAQLVLGQQQQQVGREQQVRELLGQFGTLAPQTQQQAQLAGQTADFVPQGGQFTGQIMAERPQVLDQAGLEREARRVDPIFAEKMLKSMGFDEPSKRAEASRFAASVQGLSPQLQNQRIAERAELLRSQGRDPKDTLELLDMSPEDRVQTLQNLQILDNAAKSAGQREFEALTGKLQPKERELAERIKLGLEPRAVGSAAQTISAEGTATDIAASESVIEGAKAAAKEEAKLKKQQQLLPAVKSAVTTAVANATSQARIAEEDRSNAKALNIYDTAMTGLVEAMGETSTGPVSGLMPAITAKQQIADGAVAAMAPVLKQLFRAAGEGVFTDRDQDLLLAMVPTRKDHPETRAAKLKNIDSIVRAKLGQDGGEQRTQRQEPPPPPGFQIEGQ